MAESYEKSAFLAIDFSGQKVVEPKYWGQANSLAPCGGEISCLRPRGEKIVVRLFFFGVGEQCAKAVEATLPKGAAIRNPFFNKSKSLRLDLAGADAPYFLGAHEAALLEDLQVLDHRGQRHVQRL